MQEAELVSVIVPIFNIENYIVKCVKSIINQTYRNLEIVLVNDGSTDRCGELCDQLSAMDQRIKVIHKKNGGLSDARNVGIDSSHGEYISFVDGDDFLHPVAVEIMVNNLEMNNADISEGGRVHECDFSYEEFIKRRFENKTWCFDRKQALIEMYAFTEYLHVMAWAKIYKRKLFDKIRFPKGMVHEDMAVMYLLYEQADKIVGTKAPVYFVSQREGSITRTQYKRSRLECWCRYYFEPMDFYKARNQEIFHAVQAGYLKDAVAYWRLAHNAGDEQIAGNMTDKYRECINPQSLSYFGIKRKTKILLFAIMPKFIAQMSS